MARRPPPKKEKGKKTGPRQLDGAVLDVATLARELGDTGKGVRAKVARGVLPFRRLGGRVVFLRSEVTEYLARLPGVSVEQALSNLQARTGR
jgi:hypothetical protein